MNRKAIDHIWQWVDDNSFHIVSDATDAQVLCKKLEKRFDQRSAVKKAFLLRKLVNLKYKDGSPVANHMSEFQSVVNQLGSIMLDDEI